MTIPAPTKILQNKIQMQARLEQIAKPHRSKELENPTFLQEIFS